MKALILKDLYNITRYIKSMIFMIVVFTIMFTFSADVQGLVTVSGILFGMMIMNTYTFDEMCNWERYSLSTPVTKKDIVLSKFIVLLILSLMGIGVGFIATVISLLYLGNTLNLEFFGTMGILTIISFSIAEIFGSTCIPIIYKFGVEKSRSLLILTYLIPISVFWAILKVLLILGITITEGMFFIALLCSPLIALFWNFLMYLISLHIFNKKEF